MTTATKRPIIPVEVGQRRVDPDPRMKGQRIVEVLSFDVAHAQVRANTTGARTRINLRALCKWPLVGADA